jgi:hypothetical protein
VKAYHSGDLSNAAYGIFINGEGGNNYYLFRIWPNDDCSTGGDWQLIRREDGKNNTIRRGYCEPAIKQGGNLNILKIGHKSNGTLTLYVNNEEIGSYVDSNDLDDGKATGVYVRSDDEDVRIKFDDFKVYKFIN